MLILIDKNNKHRCNGELALHVLDMIESTIQAAKTSIPKAMRTTCERPKNFSENEITQLMK